jgi:hypothetical protein
MLWAAPLVFLFAAVGPWPYGFYQFLRLVVCGTAAYLAYATLSRGSRSSLGWAFLGLAILYNPAFKVHFERQTWAVLNVGSAVPFALREASDP